MLLQAEDAEDFSNISEAISESDDEEDAEEEKKDEVKKKLKNNARGVYFPGLSFQFFPPKDGFVSGADSGICREEAGGFKKNLWGGVRTSLDLKTP